MFFLIINFILITCLFDVGLGSISAAFSSLRSSPASNLRSGKEGMIAGYPAPMSGEERGLCLRPAAGKGIIWFYQLSW